MQEQANNNTFALLTGKITFNKLMNSNRDTIPLLVYSDINDLKIKDKLDVIESMIEYFTEEEEYEKCAELVKIKNKL
jgi:hypothetical protein